MIAFHQQHLHQRAAFVLDVRGFAFDVQPVLRRRGTGRCRPAIDLDGAQFAGAVGLEFRVVAQVRNVFACGQRGLDHSLTGRVGNLVAIEGKGAGYKGAGYGFGHVGIHSEVARWAPASSRPVIWRA